jgi:hypothetical protein
MRTQKKKKTEARESGEGPQKKCNSIKKQKPYREMMRETEELETATQKKERRGQKRITHREKKGAKRSNR